MKHYTRARRDGTLSSFPPRATRLCEVEGCGRKHFTGGHCSIHHGRMRRYGTTTEPAPKPLHERMAELTDKSGSGCWTWLGKAGLNGYGRISISDRLHYAHRVAWELLNGPIPDDLTIDHLCMNRICVNPAHMEVVTRSLNSTRANNARYNRNRKAS